MFLFLTDSQEETVSPNILELKVRESVCVNFKRELMEFGRFLSKCIISSFAGRERKREDTKWF